MNYQKALNGYSAHNKTLLAFPSVTRTQTRGRFAIIAHVLVP